MLVMDPDMVGLATRIHEHAHLTGRQYRLSTGELSPEYFESYAWQVEPQLLREIAGRMIRLVPAGTEVIAGPDMGGIPLTVMLSQLTGLPSAFVRPVAKDYGTCKLIEGADVDGRRVVVVEPAIKTGRFVLGTCADLRRHGATIERVICTVDRQHGARERLAAAGYDFGALFTWEELCKARTAGGRPDAPDASPGPPPDPPDTSPGLLPEGSHPGGEPASGPVLAREGWRAAAIGAGGVLNLYGNLLQRVDGCHGGAGSVRVFRPFERSPGSPQVDFVDLAVVPPGSEIGRHQHGDDEECYVILGGRAVMHLDGRIFRVGAGDVVLNRPFGTHGLANDSEDDVLLLVFQLSPCRT